LPPFGEVSWDAIDLRKDPNGIEVAGYVLYGGLDSEGQVLA
jgi:hypothetical protein